MNILKNSKYLFLTSILLGLLIPGFAYKLEILIMPLLVIMMTVSIKDIAFRHITKTDVEEITSLALLNYVLLGGAYILFSFFLESPYRELIMILGIMPPAVGIITMSKVLEGNLKLSFLTEFSSYLIAVFFIPVASKFLLGAGFSVVNVLEVVALVILLPYFLSRLLHNYELKHPRKTDYSKMIVNLSYAITFYIIIGLNANVIFDFAYTWKIFLILFTLKFGLGTILYLVFKNFLNKKNNVLLVLFGTLKNGGMAIAFGVLLFGVEATVPYAINGITTPLYIVYLEWLLK